ncbi:hypothetical protein HK096_006889, partial [Nowakowskiella sp. JEL0078]
GASLFYTSNKSIKSLILLRKYILHRLFPPVNSPAPQPIQPSPSKNNPAESNASSTVKPIAQGQPQLVMPFDLPAQVIEREPVFVPSGWDSWGKIKSLNNEFDCRSMAGLDDHGKTKQSGWAEARKLYDKTIPDLNSLNPSMDADFIAAKEEQDFLEELRSKLELNESAKAIPPAVTNSPALNGSTASSLNGSNDSLATLPQIDRKVVFPFYSFKSKQKESRPTLKTGPQDLSIPSPQSASANSSVGSNEVISNFFQSLLNKKSSPTTPSASAVTAAAAAAAAASLATSGKPQTLKTTNGTANMVRTASNSESSAVTMGRVTSNGGSVASVAKMEKMEKMKAQVAKIKADQDRQEAELKALKEDDTPIGKEG